MNSVELFAGAGGLALGISGAGFKSKAILEWNSHACHTIRMNQRRRIKPVVDWPLVQGDVRHFNYSDITGPVELVAGGPPCQPFSLGGKHRGNKDTRDMFPEAVRAVRELAPRAFIFENVKGLLRQSFAKYFGYIVLQLTYPEIARKSDESWTDHQSRLENYHTQGKPSGLHYRVVFRLLNAANYGVPQRRERVFIVGFRSDIGREWSFPDETHSHDALLWDQWISGEYWDRHAVAKKSRPSLQSEYSPRVHALGGMLFAPERKPWRTVRDAISDLPDPRSNGHAHKIANHVMNPGARSYFGHTGSPLDEPAKTLKAGDHGVPGGENMLRYPDGEVRYFTVRESARLQTFPDKFIFTGSWTENMRQLGNAVPAALGNVVASSVQSCLIQKQQKS